MARNRTTPAEMAAFAPHQLEQLFGIKFTDRERMLLETAKDLLGPIDRQRKHLLAGPGLAGMECPACQQLICQRSATVGPFLSDERDGGSSVPDDGYECNRCGAGLIFHLGLVDGEQWFTLKPGQTIVVGQGPVPS